MKAIVTGMIATYPVGGVAYDYGQYLIGMKRLGFDVIYLEDTGSQTYDPSVGDVSDNPSYGINFLQSSLSALDSSLAERWCFRDLSGQCYGMSLDELTAFVADADVFVNVSNSALLRDEYLKGPVKILIDTDPGLSHFVTFPKWDRTGGFSCSKGFRAHDFFFTYATNINHPSCTLPDFDLKWMPTRPVVIPEFWECPVTGVGDWSAVMSWNTYVKPFEYLGQLYGSKEMEFHHIEGLPRKTSRRMKIAAGGHSPPFERWRSIGWHCEKSEQISKTIEDYCSYIKSSFGELSVAKQVYVATRSGWFSCRSICYMMAGRPVVVQDTGFSRSIPTGQGVLAFTNEQEALRGLQAVEADYQNHAEAAHRIAMEYFTPVPVLGEMLRQAGVRIPDSANKEV